MVVHSSAVHLLQMIKDGRVSHDTLTARQRKICIRYFLEEQPQLTDNQIGEILGITGGWAKRYRKEIIKQDGWIVDHLDIRLHASEMYRLTMTHIKKLQKKEEWEKATKLYFEMTRVLMDMGYLPKAPIEFKNTDKLTLWDILTGEVPVNDSTKIKEIDISPDSDEMERTS